jgi:UDP-N-acetylenolpyruvoylglucosamine reductase
MQLQQNVSLLPYNTFAIDAMAEQFATLHSKDELYDIAQQEFSAINILGGGSNVLLTKPVSGLTLHNKLKGIETVAENNAHVWLRVSAGEVWHELVMHVIDKGLHGIENLALIPGTVGAAPIQNIGAYGIEAKETIDSVTAWHWQEQAFATYTNEQCKFGYRDSIFKHQLKGKVLITDVTFKLNKQPHYHITYGAIEQELEKMGVTELSSRAIANAVIAIRSSKLPDPKQIGNAGSFFKNPTIPIAHYEKLKAQYPNIPSYPFSDTMLKVPAGWLIEHCGWKGYRKGDAGVHEKQALVLVNYAKATGAEIWQLSGEILKSIEDKFGIELEREVQVW